MTPPTTGPTTFLGDGLEVSTLGFGAMALSGVYGAIDPADGLATLHHAIDRGVTFIDTADVYGAGANEELVGRLLAALDQAREAAGDKDVRIAGGGATILQIPDGRGCSCRGARPEPVLTHRRSLWLGQQLQPARERPAGQAVAAPSRFA